MGAYSKVENATESSSQAQSPLLTVAVVAPSSFTFIFCAVGIYFRKKYQIWKIRKEMILHDVQGKIFVSTFLIWKYWKDWEAGILEMYIKEYGKALSLLSKG